MVLAPASLLTKSSKSSTVISDWNLWNLLCGLFTDSCNAYLLNLGRMSDTHTHTHSLVYTPVFVL